MYPVLLAIHNLLRWVVLLLGILAILRAAFGFFRQRAWTASDRRIGVFFSSAIDTQLLLGLILYFFVSPITKTAMQDFGVAMGNPDMRFFAFEHGLLMLLAVVFAHLGSLLAKKASSDKLKHQRALLWFGLALVVILLGMPWARPLFPGLG